MDELPTRRQSQAETSVADRDNGSESVSTDGGRIDDVGTLASVACSLLMKVLWVARLARPDLLRAVNHLATKVTKWTSNCDAMMQRLMGYIQATLHLRMVWWFSDSRKQLYPNFFADADFAGDVESQRSTGGYYSVIRGPHTSFPISAGSKIQSCVSHSTP
ncbi:MAG: hypothetical protein ACKPKO_22005, partial [Candidatus Fonsibacter sp.]